eukprot:3254202-Pleurochrysis_carterae.AAC.1
MLNSIRSTVPSKFTTRQSKTRRNQMCVTECLRVDGFFPSRMDSPNTRTAHLRRVDTVNADSMHCLRWAQSLSQRSSPRSEAFLILL